MSRQAFLVRSALGAVALLALTAFGRSASASDVTAPAVPVVTGAASMAMPKKAAPVAGNSFPVAS
jgi:hypothetical protein